MTLLIGVLVISVIISFQIMLGHPVLFFGGKYFCLYFDLGLLFNNFGICVLFRVFYRNEDSLFGIGFLIRLLLLLLLHRLSLLLFLRLLFLRLLFLLLLPAVSVVFVGLPVRYRVFITGFSVFFGFLVIFVIIILRCRDILIRGFFFVFPIYGISGYGCRNIIRRKNLRRYT